MSDRHPDISALESLYRRKVLSRRQFVAALTALGMTASGIAGSMGTDPVPAFADTPQAEYLVVIVLDAFRPDYAELAPMTSLGKLARAGTVYDRAWVAQLESETPVGHASLSTGARPRNDGVIGFEWRDPSTHQEVLDGWPAGVLAGDLERDLKRAGTNSIPLAVKAADPKAKVVTLSSEKIYAADAMGGWAADYILYYQRRGATHNTLIPGAVPGHAPPADFLAQPHLQLNLPFTHFTDWDYLSSVLAESAVKHFKPKVLMVNFPGADVYGHPYGGPATPAVFRQVVAGVDRGIGRIVQSYRDAGIFDRTLFIVTADHGMVPNDRSVDGSRTAAAGAAAGGHVLIQTGGTAADIYLHNPAASRAVALAVGKLPNVASSYFRVLTGGGYQYVRPKAIQLDPNLDSAYQYLLNSFAGAASPDVVAPFRENTIDAKVNSAHGNHGGLNWGAQHIPLILSGPGVTPGAVSHFPARLIDVAPTALRLMGLPVRDMDGLALADAMTGATADEIAAQSGLEPTLIGYQDALIGQAEADIRQDRLDGVVPPPHLPLHP